jgi:DNA mismatch repair protein MutS
VAASEVDGQLLLLHQICEGAASSSFGLHVAKMAGIPPQVLNDAKRYLVDNLNMDMLKANHVKAIDDKNDLVKSVTDTSLKKHHLETEILNISENNQAAKMTDIPQQNQLFSLQYELSAIDPDSLTPKQAHDLLYHLKKIISH